MQAILNRNDYNSNITPTYFLSDNGGLAIDGQTTYRYAEDRSLHLAGGAYDVMLILEDISLHKLEQHASHSEDLSDQATKKRIIEAVTQRVNLCTAFHLSEAAVAFLTLQEFPNRRALIRDIYRLAAHVHHSGKDIHWNIQDSTLTEKHLTMYYAEDIVVRRR